MDKKILESVQERVEEDEEKQALFSAFDDMDNLRWVPPSSLLKDWVRKRVSTDPSVLANYARLKEAMSEENKGMPEWWRYNL